MILSDLYSSYSQLLRNPTMKIKLLIFIFLSNIIYSQNNYFELKTFKTSEIPTIETKFKSKKFIQTQKIVYFDEESNVSPPINYVRKATDNFPTATIEYFYSAKDSIVKSVTIDWKLNIDEKLSQQDKVEKYNALFDNLILSMTNILGVPNPNQGNLTEIESPVANDKTINYERKVVWNTNGKTIITTIVWAENHGHQMITTIK